MRIRELLESATSGATSAGNVPSLANPGGKDLADVGTFFGGTYERNPKVKPKKNKVIKRQQ